MTCHECYLSANSKFTWNTLCSVTNLCVDQGMSCNCKAKITDEDIEAARKEVEAEAERARDEAIIAACKEGINARFAGLRKHGSHGEDCTSCHEGRPKNECPESKRKCGHHCNHSWSHETCCWCGQEFGEDYADEDADTDKLTCANCSFASKSDIRVFPAGISTYFNLPGGVFYCSERDTRVPGTLVGCELHSELGKDTESDSDEAKSLDNIIDECFNEMGRLIEAGMNVGVDLVSKKSKTAYISHVPIDRDEFETEKAIIGKLTEENKANRELVANMEEAIINCLGPYGKNNIADLKVRNEKLCEENEELSNENKILQQEVALLKSKRKKDSGDIASLEIKISKMKKELSGKWRLLEVGEKPHKGDQAFLIDSNNVRIWVEPNGFKGIVKEETVPVRRKITI